MPCGCTEKRPLPPMRLVGLRTYDLGNADPTGAWPARGVTGELVRGPVQLVGVFDCEPGRPHDDTRVSDGLAAQPVQAGSPILRVRLPYSSQGRGRSVVPPSLGLQLWVGGLDSFDLGILGALATWSKGGAGSLDPTEADLGIPAADVARRAHRVALIRSARPALDVLPYAHQGDVSLDLRALAGGSRYVVAFLRAVETGGYPFVGHCRLRWEVVAGEPGPQVWRDRWHGVGFVEGQFSTDTYPPTRFDDWLGEGEAQLPTVAGQGRATFIEAGSGSGWVGVWNQSGALATRSVLHLSPGAYQLNTADLGLVAGPLRVTVARDASGASRPMALGFYTVAR